MTPFCLIPARGGSKGIPRKNLAEVGGRSLLSRAIDCAHEAGVFGTHVYVSTDDAEIANHAVACEARQIARPPEFSGDDATTESAMLHALYVWRQWQLQPSHVVLLQCTAPLTQPSDVRRCYEACVALGYDSAFCASSFHGKVWRDVGGEADPVNHDGRQRQPRQRDFAQFLEAGSVYCVSVAAFLASAPEPSRFAGRTAIVETGASRTFEIDDQWQLERARVICGE